MSVVRRNVIFPKIWASLMFGIFSLLCVYVGVTGADTAYNQIRELIGISTSQPHQAGQFRQDGNPGTILFGAKPSDGGYSGAQLYIPENGASILTGSFWMETIGWTTLSGITFEPVGQNIWSLSGYAWSAQAGWIDLSTTTYHLSDTSFSGYAWNDGIGWIDMSSASLDMTSIGAIGKVKIIGTLGGNRIFDTTYTLEGEISPATTTKLINEVRKNISLVTRNLPIDKINTALLTNRIFEGGSLVNMIGNKIVFENTSSTVARVNYSSSIQEKLENAGLIEPTYSAIVIGADVYIDDSVIPQSDGKPRAIIVLKNEAGVGGNIYISGYVPQIFSSLIAEGSLYSGFFSGSTTSPTIYNDDANNLFKIPNRQLYIYGTVISNNTIGGYSIDNNITNSCPYNITPCDNNRALTYDFNHFRDFQKDALDAFQMRGYQPPGFSAPSNTLDDYSMIIEYDPRILGTPPPGLERIR